MKAFLTWLLAFALVLCAGCSVTADSLAPTQREQFLALDADLQTAEVTLVEARQNGDERAVADAEAAVAEAERRLAEFESSVLQDRYGPILSAVSAVPVVGPFVAGLGPAALGLIPLLGRRGRKHYANAVKSVNPFDQSRSPLDAIGDIAKAFGLKHSSEASQVAADATS